MGVLPDTAQAQCGDCNWVKHWFWGWGYLCQGPMDNPEYPPHCFGTMLFRVACHSCPNPRAQEDGAELASGQTSIVSSDVVLDGSYQQLHGYKAALTRDPEAGLTDSAAARSIAFYPCNGAIAARRYAENTEQRLRRESTVIRI